MSGTKEPSLNTLNAIDFVGSTALTLLGAAMVFVTLFIGFAGFAA